MNWTQLNINQNAIKGENKNGTHHYVKLPNTDNYILVSKKVLKNRSDGWSAILSILPTQNFWVFQQKRNGFFEKINEMNGENVIRYFEKSSEVVGNNANINNNFIKPEKNIPEEKIINQNDLKVIDELKIDDEEIDDLWD